jgi:S1-C subfamily serine protease
MAWHAGPAGGDHLAAQKGAAGRGSRADGYLGVKVVENAETLEDIGDHVGVRVESVVENSPAQFAGILKGDVIEKLAGKSYDWPEKFYAAVAALKPGAPVKITLLRDDVGLELEVVPGRRAARRGPRKLLFFAETKHVGVRIRGLSRKAARAAGLPANEGIEVVGFWGKSPWQRDGVRKGDILHKLDARPLHDPREFLRRIALKTPGDAVTLEVLREGRRQAIRSVISRRKRRTERVLVPLLYNYTSKTPESGSWGVLFDIFQVHWKDGQNTTTVLWIISWTTGEADELEELPVPPEGVEP